AWLDNRWFRSILINVGVDMPLRGKDWRIKPASVQPEWLIHDDGRRVLRIRGSIINLLTSAVTLPAIKISFYSKIEPDKQIGAAKLEIRQTLPEAPAHSSPGIAPTRDTAPVQGLGSRSFTLVVESVPENTGDFILTPVPR
ncbi:MAG: DUF3426 domain-containing protein, partial [Mariprofundaceae bacterium]|nr:DUF3426 domain-containing protein [Mariprofundaceae bacterium]